MLESGTAICQQFQPNNYGLDSYLQGARFLIDFTKNVDCASQVDMLCSSIACVYYSSSVQLTHPALPTTAHMCMLRAGLYNYTAGTEWMVIAVWALPPLLNGWVHSCNPLLWLCFSPKCLSATGIAAAPPLNDGVHTTAAGIPVRSWDVFITKLQWMLMIAGAFGLFFGPVRSSVTPSYTPAYLLLALSVAVPALQLRSLTKRVVRLVTLNEEHLDLRWRGMKVLAQVCLCTSLILKVRKTASSVMIPLYYALNEARICLYWKSYWCNRKMIGVTEQWLIYYCAYCF
jgi:hypothetical protein